MKRRDPAAEQLESAYILEVKNLLSLQNILESEANEILQDLKEHIEEALNEENDLVISRQAMSKLLERLGSPVDYLMDFFPFQETKDKKKTTKMKMNGGYKFSLFLNLILLTLLGICGYWTFFKQYDNTLNILSKQMLKNDESNIKSIDIHFDKVLNQESVDSGSIQLYPELTGACHLKGPSTISYELKETPLKGTKYLILLSSNIRGENGEHLTSHRLSFQTKTLSISDIKQVKTGADGSVLISLEFSDRVDPLILKKYLSLSYQRAFNDKSWNASNEKWPKPVDYKIVTKTNNNRILVKINNLKYESITIIIQKGLKGVSGPLGLKESLAKRIKVSMELEFLKLKTTSYYNNQKGIRVEMTSPINIVSAKNYIFLDPHVKFYLDGSYDGFTIYGDFEPNQRYQVKLKKGLHGISGAGVLKDDVIRSVWFPKEKLKKIIDFPYDGGYFSTSNNLIVPVESQNLDKAKLKIKKLYPSNVVEYSLDSPFRYLGEKWAKTIGEFDLELPNKGNKRNETLIDFRKYLDEQPQGIYEFTLEDKKSYSKDSCLLIITDIGLTAKFYEQQMIVWTTSMKSAKPIQDVHIEVYNNKRQKVGEGQTNEKGLLQIELKPMPKDEYPYLIIAKKQNDLSFLSFQKNRRFHESSYFSDRSFMEKNYECFLFTERGVYRPGDKVKVGGWIRDNQMSVPEKFPLELRLYSDLNLVLNQTIINPGFQGSLTHIQTLSQTIACGDYQLKIFLPGENQCLGSVSFQVADYVPQTLKSKLNAKDGALDLSKDFLINVKSEHLFGDPASGLISTCKAYFKNASFKSQFYPYYHFNYYYDREFSKEKTYPTQILNDLGETQFEIPKNDINHQNSVVSAVFEVGVQETGGRTLTKRLRRKFYSYDQYIGLKVNNKELAAPCDADISFVSVSKGGALIQQNEKITVKLIKIKHHMILEKDSRGKLKYRWMKDREVLLETRIKLEDGLGSFKPHISEPGYYRIEATTYSMGSNHLFHEFTVCGNGLNWYSENPDKLELFMNKDVYSVGDEASIRILSPFSGTALLTIESDQILESRVIKLKSGENIQKIQVNENFRPNVYIHVSLIRPVLAEKEWTPHCAAGFEQLRVDSSDKTIEIKMELPERVGPNQDLPVSVTLNHKDQPVSDSSVFLFAVSEGVLALTGYETPSPLEYFYSYKSHVFKSFDLFSQLMPVLSRWKVLNQQNPGGGSNRRRPNKHDLGLIQTQRVKTPVVFLKNLKTDSNGQINTRIKIPQFNGALRFMAVCAKNDLWGQMEKEVKVKSNLFFKASWPRFLNQGDEFIVSLTIFNQTDETGNIDIDCKFSKNYLQFQKAIPEVKIKANSQKKINIHLKANEIGAETINLMIRLNSNSYDEVLNVPIQPGRTRVIKSEFLELQGGVEHVLKCSSQFIKNSGQFQLYIAGSSFVELISLIQNLKEYPYGCIEQRTSSFFPHIYFDDLVSLYDKENSNTYKDYLKFKIYELYDFLTDDGGFALWPGGERSYPFGTIYAYDFLIEAKKNHIKVPEDLLNSLKNYISENIQKWLHSNSLGEAAYGLLVLAKSQKSSYSWLSKLEEIILENEKNNVRFPYSIKVHYLLTMKLLNKTSHEKILNNQFNYQSLQRSTGGYLHSPLREQAMFLSLLMDIEPESNEIPKIVQRLRKSLKNHRIFTTQENASILMALGKYARKSSEAGDSMVHLTLPDGQKKSFQASKGFTLKNLRPEQTVLMKSEGIHPIYVFSNSKGIPVKQIINDQDNSIQVRRSFYEFQSSKPMKDKLFEQGKLYKIRLEIESSVDVDNVLIADLLPAGLEIENPSLKGTAGLNKISNQYPLLKPLHHEIKDDRYLLFLEPLYAQQRKEFWYVVRAVTKGKFTLPSVRAECLYDHSINSIYGQDQIFVKSSDNKV